MTIMIKIVNYKIYTVHNSSYSSVGSRHSSQPHNITNTQPLVKVSAHSFEHRKNGQLFGSLSFLRLSKTSSNFSFFNPRCCAKRAFRKLAAVPPLKLPRPRPAEAVLPMSSWMTRFTCLINWLAILKRKKNKHILFAYVCIGTLDTSKLGKIWQVLLGL